jgi:hypothetical protein
MGSSKEPSTADKLIATGNALSRTGSQITRSYCSSLISLIFVAILFMTCTHQCSGDSNTSTPSRSSKRSGFTEDIAQKRLDKATTETLALFHTVIPEGTLNWDTCKRTWLEDKQQVLVEFEYSRLNALGVREQYKYWVWWNEDITKVEHEKEKFLYYRE